MHIEEGGKFFLASQYSLEALYEYKLIREDLYTLLKENQLLFPSLKSRDKEEKKALYLFLKEHFIEKLPPIPLWDKLKENFLSLVEFSRKEGGEFYWNFSFSSSLREAIAFLEQVGISYAYEVVGESQEKVANFLGISRGSLQHKLKKYGGRGKDD